MTQQDTGLSFDPTDFTAGGFLDDVDVTVVDAEVVEYDFEGKAAEVSCCLAVTFKADDADEPSRPQYYKIGPLTKYAPNSSKTGYVSVSGAGGAMNKNAKAAHFMAALKNVGFDFAAFKTAGVRGLIGTRLHLTTVTLPAFTLRDGTVKSDDKVTVPTKLLEAAATGKKAATGGKRAAGAGKKADAAPAEAAESGGGSAADEAAVEAILGKLAEAGTLAKSSLPSLMFQSIKDAASRNAAVKLVTQDAWLGSEDRPWSYDKGELSLG